MRLDDRNRERSSQMDLTGPRKSALVRDCMALSQKGSSGLPRTEVRPGVLRKRSSEVLRVPHHRSTSSAGVGLFGGRPPCHVQVQKTGSGMWGHDQGSLSRRLSVRNT